MFSDCVHVVFLCAAVFGSDESHTEKYNPFDKFFPHLTTEKEETALFKMYRWRNHPTVPTNRPPPRGRELELETIEATTTEEPDDCQGDFIIVPDVTPISDGHPYLDKFGKRPRKIY